MTDEEIMRENPEKYKKELKKMRFQQKYYHKGAFFNDDDQISQTLKQRDFSLPTGEDKLDKTVLPKVLQVKNFGRSGRTKYTHLKDQDTTVADSPWAQDTKIRKKFEEKLGGLKPDSYLTKRKRDDRD
ncbi:MAG: microfibrillar-associated 1 family protein [Legionella sp.]|nr:microfibrillar-associated 1 family protein [Legionella sp.]